MRKIEITLPEVQKLIRELMIILNIEHMPTSTEVKKCHIKGLDGYVGRMGGYKVVADSMNLDAKVRRTYLNDKDIEKEILECASKFDLPHMPSTKQILDFSDGNYVLHNKIARSGGYRIWADKLNLSYNLSTTQLGQDNEIKAEELLKNRGYSVEQMSTGFSYDLLVNKCIKIDAKSARAYNLNGSRCHTFGINKKHQACDLYMMFALSETGEQERMFIIPSHEVKVLTLSIGNKSKYNKYIDKWSYIEQYDEFYKNMKL